MVVGIAGGVAVGKSVLAQALAIALTTDESTSVVVLSADAFLFSNSILNQRGLSMRKGFPESYDTAALRAALTALRAGEEISIPVYSHDHYDIITGVTEEVGVTDVVIFEGLHVLHQGESLIDLGVFITASEELQQKWFVNRFIEMCEAGEGFYEDMAQLSERQRRSIADLTWREINLPNLREHIVNEQVLADYVVTKGPDHSIINGV